MRVSSMPIVGKIPRPASDRPDQNFWPAAPTSGLATRVLLEDTSAISAAFHFHRANAFRSSTCSLEFHDRRRRVWRKERVLLARRISRIFVMEGEASSRASSTSGRPTLWSRRNRELERDKGELGWKLGVVRESIWESNSREMGRIFFSIVLSSGCNSYVVWFVTDASNTSLNGSQSQRVLTMPARLR